MFENILGHDRNKAKFQKLDNDSLRQTYLFVGSEGIGKRTFALELANKFIGNSRNLSVVSPEKGNISVDVIRKLEEEFIPSIPLGGLSYKKFIIIDGAECLNEPSSNALLKVIEEPPAWCVFIFIADDLSHILDTIKSRCFIEKFYLVDKGLIDKYIIDNLGITDDLFMNFLVVAIGGRIGRLIEMKDSNDVLNEYRLLYDTSLKVSSLKTTKGVKPVSEMFSLDNPVKAMYELQTIAQYYIYRYYMGDSSLENIICLLNSTHANIKKGGSVNLSIELMLMKIIKINKRSR